MYVIGGETQSYRAIAGHGATALLAARLRVLALQMI